MELLQLEMFVAVADHGSITKAAAAMLRAPSNLSTRIQQLEQEIGTALLVRDKRQTLLSADGEQFLDLAREILRLSTEAKNLIRRGEPGGLFRLGALESTAAVRIPELLANYHQQYRDVELELKAQSSGKLNEALLDGRLMAAFNDGAPKSPMLDGMKAFDERLVVIAPRTVDVDSEQFRESDPTVFMFGVDCSYRQRFEDWLGVESIRPGRVVEIASYYSMLACVASGSGIAMLPQSLLETLPGGERVRSFPIKAPLGRAETWLVWRRDCRSANLTALKEMLGASQQRSAPALVTPAYGEQAS